MRQLKLANVLNPAQYVAPKMSMAATANKSIRTPAVGQNTFSGVAPKPAVAPTSTPAATMVRSGAAPRM